MIVYGAQVVAWVARETNGDYWPERSQALGLWRGGEIVAGVVFTDWNHKSVCCHMAITGTATRAFFWSAFDYAFRQLGVHKIIAMVCSNNARMVKLALHMGFKPEALIEDAQPDGDLLMFTMTTAECRFLEEKYNGKKGRQTAHA